MSSGDVRLELDGDQGFVESNLQKLLPLLNNGVTRTGDDGEADTERHAGAARQTLKNFMKEKSPGNSYEAIAAVLHYKRQNEGKDELPAAEIRNALLQGGYRPPDQMPQALTDCRRKYGYVEVGSKKGLWRLSHQGDTLMEIDLPRVKGQ